MPPFNLSLEALNGATFLDLGASKGGSLRYCANRFGGRGLGIDLDEQKVAVAREAGIEVVWGDAATLNLRDAVRYVAAMDFFEHLSGIELTRTILRAAAEAATDFIFIRHPSFEAEHYLRKLGLCQYWHEWSGHPNHLRVSDYCELFADLGLTRYAIEYVGRVDDASHPSIIPVGHRNTHRYSAEVHGPKVQTAFEEPVWRLQHIYVDLGTLGGKAWRSVVGNGPPIDFYQRDG